MNKEKTKVVFRVWGPKNGGGIIAMFPQIPTDEFGYSCQMYQHVGQHGGGHTDTVVQQTRLAKSSQYVELWRELRRIGYRNLMIGKRCTVKDRKIRQATAKQGIFGA